LFDTIFLVFESKIETESFKNSKRKTWCTVKQIRELENRSVLVEQLIVQRLREPYLQSTVSLNYGIEEQDL